jgi:hypothetical protein
MDTEVKRHIVQSDAVTMFWFFLFWTVSMCIGFVIGLYVGWHWHGS